MQKKTSIIIGAIVVAIVAAVLIFSSHSAQTVPTDNSYTPPSGNPPTDTTPNGDTTGTTTGTTPQGPTTYTLADVSKHNNASSCWTTINGGVYDVTSWINQHPGGPDKILSLCGIDGSSAFNAQHGGQARPASELASFKIGVLAQ